MSFFLRATQLGSALAFLMLTHCGGRTFDVIHTSTAKLQQGDEVGTLYFVDFAPLRLLDSGVMQQQGVSRAELTQVQLRGMTLTVLMPGSSQDLTFLSGVSVSIAAPGLPTRTVATADNFVPGQNLGALTVQTDNILPYFAKVDPQLILTTQGQPAPQDIVLRADITFVIGVSSRRILLE